MHSRPGRVVALVQARLGSTRFPGKMLAPLGGQPLLAWVLKRLQRSQRIDRLVLATSTEPRDQALIALARSLDVATFTGSESDVLGRFAVAALEHQADTVVRVCADNPFIDAAVVDQLIDFYATNDCDYACNHLDRLGSRFADGFGAEILGAPLLQQLDRETSDARHREHVTIALWDHAERYRLVAPAAPPSLAHPELRFDVDRPEDLAALETLVREQGLTLESTAAEVIAARLR